MKRPILFIVLTMPLALVAVACMFLGIAGERLLFWLSEIEFNLRRPARPDAPTKET